MLREPSLILTQGEPSLDELLGEPIVQLIMARDGVKAQDMRTTIDELLIQYRPLPHSFQ